MATTNPLLASLDLKDSDKIISIKENGNVDSNFVITHIFKQIFAVNNKLCLVILHNTLGHYHNVGKRLGYDLLKKIDEGAVKTVEPLKDIVEDIGNETLYFLEDKEEIVKRLFITIRNNVEELVASTANKVYLIIDDISHLLDLGVDLKFIISFVNCCLGLVSDRICVVINNHVCSKSDEIISNNLNYVSDVNIEVLPLKTGVSSQVTGILNVEKAGISKVAQFQYKAFDRGIKTFHLGEAVYNLYQ